MIEWQWCTLDDLSARQVYAVLAVRGAVFVVEQNCVYGDIDGLDLDAMHLIGWSGTEAAAYTRVLAPGASFAEPSIGRVLTAQTFRSSGLGRELFAKSIAHTEALYPGQNIRIGAQAHLQRFYGSFGFVRASEDYIEDGIVHVEMLRRAGIRE
ncbi:MAG TPA: GNAT family N-acetyltransferase [Steroidobacteraceae bacterium]|jgi:ElaA protein